MKSPPRGSTIMERTVAARAYINGTARNEEHAAGLEMAAFMAIFHPNHDPAKTAAMVRDARQPKRRGGSGG